MDEAFWIANRTTLVGSMTPASIRFSNLSVWALKPDLGLRAPGPWPPRCCLRARRWWRSSAAAPRARGGRSRCPTRTSWARSLSLSGLVEGRDGAQQGDAAAGDDAFLDRRLGRVHRVLDAGLLLLHLGLGGRPDLDHGHAAHELGQPLLELLAVVVGGRLLDLGADLLDPALDRPWPCPRPR